MFSSKVSDGLCKIGFSFLSEGFSISDVLDALFKSSCVFDNSLSGVVNSCLRDTHEGGVGGELVIFFLEGEGNTGD